ncbi:MAG TPA: thiamine phosphate synthase [Chloroflexota bacterium]|jgi:thiamine-phosphate diphosphorylase|nr:thiamine phosphate synthase [Chloroflexota bacterium]
MNASVLGVYVILDPDHCGGRSLPELARQAVQGGATLLQLRAEGRSTYEQVLLARALRTVTRELQVPLVINDRVDVALASQADGVHVGHPDVEDMPPELARQLLGPRAIIGVSVATPTEAAATTGRGAGYLSIGPIFGTASKGDAGPAIGLDRLAAVRAAVKLPICAIGGITAANAAAAMAAGADGVAVISAVTMAGDVLAATRQLAAAVRGAGADDSIRRDPLP